MTTILVTGAKGLVGSALVHELAARPGFRVIATDLNVQGEWPAGVETVAADLLGADWTALLSGRKVQRVVHLAAVVATQAGRDAERIHAIEVGGTQRLHQACCAAGVEQFIVASSGAAYGYAPGLPEPVNEDWPLRPHPDFPYSAHKQEIEHWLASQKSGPRVCVLRLCTVLAPGRSTAVTALFEKRPMLALHGCRSPFCFIHRDDVAACMRHMLELNAQGVYNLAGDGVLELREIAQLMNAPVRELPASLLRTGIRLARGLRLTQFTPGQVDFLAYRPVLDNRKLKRETGFMPRYDSRGTFMAWLAGFQK